MSHLKNNNEQNVSVKYRKRLKLWIPGHPFAATCILFVLIKLLYLFIGYYRDLNVQSYEGLARLLHAYNFSGFSPLEMDIPWLPLPSILQSLFYIPDIFPWFMGSLYQTVISTAAGIFAALLAREIADGDWKAGVLTLAAITASADLSILGISYLSEPLYQLEILAILYFALLWMKDGRLKWKRLTGYFLLALLLTRYEGWILAAIWFLILLTAVKDSRKKGIWKEYKGLWQVKWLDFIYLALFIIAVPGIWMLINQALRNDPFFFKKVTEKSFRANVIVSKINLLTFYVEFLARIWETRPTVVLIAILTLFTPTVLRSPAFIIIMTIGVLTLSNYHFIMKGSTAFSYPERLSLTPYILCCPLFGLMVSHFFTKLKNKYHHKRIFQNLLIIVLVLLPVMGYMDFQSRSPVLREEFGKDMADILKEEFKKNPDASKPGVLIETTDWDYSIVIFYVGMDESNIRHFNRKDGDNPMLILHKNPSIRFLLLNPTKRNIELIRKIDNAELVKIGSIWNLYEIKK